MAILGTPPDLPNMHGLPLPVQSYLIRLQAWSSDVYRIVRQLDIGDVKVTSSSAAPSGGQDGDVHVRVATTNTALYLNINGSWSAYTNP